LGVLVRAIHGVIRVFDNKKTETPWPGMRYMMQHLRSGEFGTPPADAVALKKKIVNARQQKTRLTYCGTVRMQIERSFCEN